MFKRKAVKEAKKLVWRMSPTNLAGEFVSPLEPRAARPPPAEIHKGGLLESTLELTDGSEVSETEMSTLPGELVDEFLKPS